jgi:hypothetical protein
MQIIIPKSDLESFKERLSSFKEIDSKTKELFNGVPLITSELIPTGHYIIDDGTQMKIYYPDGKIAVIPGVFNDLFQMPKFEIKPEKFNFNKTK